MASSTLTILDRLLDQANSLESREHVLEQASYAVKDVQQRLLGKFESLVEEISQELGHPPEFNASTESQEGRNPMPGWVMGGSKASDATQKVLRLSYWKREQGISYVLLRTELDSKDRPKYYDLVLGARRRSKGEPIKVTKLRSADTSFMGMVKRFFTFKKSENQ